MRGLVGIVVRLAFALVGLSIVAVGYWVIYPERMAHAPALPGWLAGLSLERQIIGVVTMVFGGLATLDAALGHARRPKPATPKTAPGLEADTQFVAEPAAGVPVPDITPVAETVAEPVAEAAPETPSEPVIEPVSEGAAPEPVAEIAEATPVAEVAHPPGPVAEPVAELAAEPVVQPTVDPATPALPVAATPIFAPGQASARAPIPATEADLERLETVLTASRARRVSDPGPASDAACADALIDVADMEEADGRADRALPLYEEALALRRRLATVASDDPVRQRQLSLALERLGDVREQRGHRTRALDLYKESLSIAERLAAAHPNEALLVSDLAAARARTSELEGRFLNE